MDSLDLENRKVWEVIKISSSYLPDHEYELRAVIKIEEETPSGPKCNYKEEEIVENTLENAGLVYGGIVLVCPRGDRTNGKSYLEISCRDETIRVNDIKKERTASILCDMLNSHNHHFKIFGSET